MEDIGSQEDAELGKEDLTLSGRELPIESVGHCQSVAGRLLRMRRPSPPLEPGNRVLSHLKVGSLPDC
jgi:hypothetical protein